MPYKLSILSILDRSPQHSLSNSLKIQKTNMFQMNKLNKRLTKQPSMSQLHNLPSPQLNLWLRSTTLRDMPCIIMTRLRLLGKTQQDNLSTQFQRQKNRIPKSNFPSQCSGPWSRNMILQDMPYKL